MATSGFFTLIDHNGEVSTMQVRTGDITAASLPGALTQWGALRTAIEGITLGTVGQEGLYVFNTKLSNAQPSDVNAQRERKWLVVYEDDTATIGVGVNNPGYKKVFTLEIPTADLAGVTLIANTDEADLADTDMAAFVSAFEALCKSPYGGDVKVLRVVHVGRRG